MKMRLFAIAAVAGAALCGVSGLLYAQDVSLYDGVIPSRSVWSGVYTMDQVAKGRKLYEEACAQCHLPQLQGDGSEGVPPLVGTHFMVDWDSIPLSDLVRHMHAQPNDTPGDIDTEAATNLTAFILFSNQVPAGKTPLPDNQRAVAQIRITAEKPK